MLMFVSNRHFHFDCHTIVSDRCGNLSFNASNRQSRSAYMCMNGWHLLGLWIARHRAIRSDLRFRACDPQIEPRFLMGFLGFFLNSLNHFFKQIN